MSLTPPNAVIFDLGKVLLDFNYGRAAQVMAERSRVSEEVIRDALDQSALLYRFETGELSAREMFKEVVELSGYNGDFHEFAVAFGDIFTEIPEMIQLHASLRAANIPTYILSNTNELAVAFIRETYPFFRTFTGHVYSHVTRCMKPASAIYDEVERLSGLRGAELLYIDDRKENVLAGADRGWQVIHHVCASETVAAVMNRLHLGRGKSVGKV